MEFLQGIKPREYQQKIFETCKEKNCLVVLPTGLGKTLIALMLSIERLKSFPEKKVLFLAPTKPLAEQHQKYFKKHLPELFADIQLFTGAVSAEKRKKIWQMADIIFSTPQCIANDLKNGLYDLQDICLLVEDEAHRCINNYDYNYVAREYGAQTKNQRVLGLTASPGDEIKKIKEICKNLSIEEVEIRTRISPDVRENLQELEFEKVFVDFPSEFDEMRRALKKIFNDLIDSLKSRSLLFEPPTKINLIKLQKKLFSMISGGNRNFNTLKGISICSNTIKLQHALELLETQTLSGFHEYLKNLVEQSEMGKSKGVQQLVKKPEFNFVSAKSSELLLKDFEHPKIKELARIIEQERTRNNEVKILIFSQFRETAVRISKKLNELEGIKSKVFVGQSKKIYAGESTGLNQKEQGKMIEDFSSGKINVLCATSIGEEGLDIPEVGVVIFYETIPSAIRAIQRAGRTARLQKGKLIILITAKTRDETFYYVSRKKEKRMDSAINSIKEEFYQNKDQLNNNSNDSDSPNSNEQKTISDYFK